MAEYCARVSSKSDRERDGHTARQSQQTRTRKACEEKKHASMCYIHPTDQGLWIAEVGATGQQLQEPRIDLVRDKVRN